MSEEVKELYETIAGMDELIANAYLRGGVPLSIYNEVRNMNQHLYAALTGNQENSADQIYRAERHALRIIKDCFKLVISYLDKELNETLSFFKNYNFHKNDTAEKVFNTTAKSLLKSRELFLKAKSLEVESKTNEALDMYDQCYNTLYDAISLKNKEREIFKKLKWIQTKSTLIKWALAISFAIAGFLIGVCIKK